MTKKIFSKKNLILIVIIAACIVVSCAAVTTFASYAREVTSEGTASPRGGYIGKVGTFEYSDVSVDSSFSYNFYLTNVNDQGVVGAQSSTIDFSLVMYKTFAEDFTRLNVEANIDGEWRRLDHTFNGAVALFSDTSGFKGSKARINYYRINFALDEPIELKSEAMLFEVTYRGDFVIDTADDDKKVDIKVQGKEHQVYLNEVKATLQNSENFNIIAADIDENYIIINVYYYGQSVDTVAVKTERYKEQGILHSTPRLYDKRLGGEIAAGYFGEGYSIVVYCPTLMNDKVVLIGG